MPIYSRVAALKTQLENARQALADCTSVRAYDNTRAQIAYLRDLLARRYNVEA